MIDNDLDEGKMKQLIERNGKKIDFIEPQSMNFDKKINSTFKQFLAKDSQAQLDLAQATKQPEDKQYDNDSLFAFPRAARQLSHLDASQDFMKRMKKAAKLHVLEQQEAQAARQQQLLEGSDSGRPEPPAVKKKLSPRTLEKIKLQTRKKIREFKRDIIRCDDFKAINMLSEALRCQRVDSETGELTHRPQIKVPGPSFRGSGHNDHKSLKSNRGSRGSIEGSVDQNSVMMPDFKGKSKKSTHILSDLSQIISNKKKKQGKKTASSGTRMMNNLVASGVSNPHSSTASTSI